MIIINDILGNYHTLKDTYADYTLHTVKLEQWESSKSRIKKVASSGHDIAISLDRGKHLHNKDILWVDDENKIVIIVDIELKNVLKISLANDISQAVLFKLGHALGNQHWPAILKDACVYVPLYVDEKIMRSMLKTHNFTDIDIEFIQGDALVESLDASECRLLFSGDDSSVHKHH